MQLINKVFGAVRTASKRQVLLAIGFMLAMVLSASLGLAYKQYGSAATERECDDNAILKCGALDRYELIDNIRHNNADHQLQYDLAAIYADYGLTSDKYDRFASTARMGTVYRDGRVEVEGQTVATGAWSLGRQSWGKSCRQEKWIAGNRYYTSTTDCSFSTSTNSLPVMVMFDGNGVVETVIMTACGNPVRTTPSVPSYSCDMLNKTPVAGKLNTYDFSTKASVAGNASIVEVVYNFGDGTSEKHGYGEVVRHTFSKPDNYQVTATVTFKLPGGVTKTATSVHCTKTVTVETPVAICSSLVKTAIDTNARKYSFTVSGEGKNGAVIKTADFVYDGKTVVAGVKPGGDGKITDVRAFNDYDAHTVVAKINFDILGKLESRTSAQCQVAIPATDKPYVACSALTKVVVDESKRSYKFVAKAEAQKAKVISADFIYDNSVTVAGIKPGSDGTMADARAFNDYDGHKVVANITFDVDGQKVVKTNANCEVALPPVNKPYCKVPGKENLPPDSPQCYENCPVPGKETLPKGSPECAAQVVASSQPLPNTGPGDVFGLFAGAATIGGLAHRYLARRRG
jgi:hypothetical protein